MEFLTYIIKKLIFTFKVETLWKALDLKYKILEDFEVEQNMADTIISYLEEKYLDSIEKNIWFDTLINEYTKEERLDKAQNYVDNSALQVKRIAHIFISLCKFTSLSNLNHFDYRLFCTKFWQMKIKKICR
ncbi:hypothetical protein RIR_jg3925.t1 [Rhizophagus irregularis DAOM 181602=DAOM 197198]|nr:hypothetical protein RIR_jg3925.t1 [Rhizophagus irregularis DAOM 181602=DAOM 197198]